MSSLALFCLRAAASRAARINTRTANRYFRAGQPAAMWATVRAATRRAEAAKYRYFDAKCEAQRAGLAALSRPSILTKAKSYALAAWVMTPAPRTLAKVARTSEILAWLRDLTIQATANNLINCPASLPVVGASAKS